MMSLALTLLFLASSAQTGSVRALAVPASAPVVADVEEVAKESLALMSSGIKEHEPGQVAEALGDIDDVYAKVSPKTRKKINKALGTQIKIETTQSLPEGGDCCMRRIWVE